MKRRRFIQCVGLAVANGIKSIPPSAFGQQRAHLKELNADLIVIGGGVGGCAAALAAVRNGLRVILTEETDWIGGQLTQQAVPPDEHPWIEIFGATRSYREFRSKIRDYYYRNYPLTPQAGSRRALNPGNGSVSKLCHEPRVALAVLEQLLAPYGSGYQLIVLRRHKAVSADTHSDSVKAVTVRSLDSGDNLTLSGQFFIDATEMGDLLPLSHRLRITTPDPGTPFAS